MEKKTVTTVTEKYNEKGELVERITVTEIEEKDTQQTPNIPFTPVQPNTPPFWPCPITVSSEYLSKEK